MESSDIYNLGYRTKDVNESIYWLNLAAEKGHIGAQKKLAEIYEDGQKVTQNYDEAIKWYSMAAYLGDTQAQRKLGICYIIYKKIMVMTRIMDFFSQF